MRRQYYLFLQLPDLSSTVLFEDSILRHLSEIPVRYDIPEKVLFSSSDVALTTYILQSSQQIRVADMSRLLSHCRERGTDLCLEVMLRIGAFAQSREYAEDALGTICLSDASPNLLLAALCATLGDEDFSTISRHWRFGDSEEFQCLQLCHAIGAKNFYSPLQMARLFLRGISALNVLRSAFARFPQWDSKSKYATFLNEYSERNVRLIARPLLADAKALALKPSADE